MLGLLERPSALSPLQHCRDMGSDPLVLSLAVSPGPQKIPWPSGSTERTQITLTEQKLPAQGTSSGTQTCS